MAMSASNVLLRVGLAAVCMVAVACGAAPAAATTPPIPAATALATFDGAQGTTWDWRLVNDPVMGGVSNSTFSITGGVMAWHGAVKVVPKLKAPGFCNLETQRFGRANSVAATTHFVMRVRSSTPQYYGFKVSFAALTLNPQFASFKANYNVTVGNEWSLVSIPWDQFSNDWSAFTGDCDTTDPTGQVHHCCSAAHPDVCPKPADLAHIQGLGLWAEGTAGQFTLEVDFIGAGNMTSHYTGAFTMPARESVAITKAERAAIRGSTSDPYVCKGPIQSNLKYNVSDRLASEYLPFRFPLGTTLAQAICCDGYWEAYAEPKDFYSLPSVDLFGRLEAGVTTFYDPVCGIPLFRAPVNRTLAQFEADTASHGWPSFREGEVVTENIIVQPESGMAFSTCGTHLGTYFPKAPGGPRYCIDLTCVSGHAASA